MKNLADVQHPPGVGGGGVGSGVAKTNFNTNISVGKNTSNKAVGQCDANPVASAPG